MAAQVTYIDQTGGFSSPHNFDPIYLEPGYYAGWCAIVKGTATNISLLWQVQSIIGAAGYGVLSTAWQATAPQITTLLGLLSTDQTYAFTLCAPSNLVAGAGPINAGPFPGGYGRFRIAFSGSPDSSTRVKLCMQRALPPLET